MDIARVCSNGGKCQPYDRQIKKNMARSAFSAPKLFSLIQLDGEKLTLTLYTLRMHVFQL